MTGTGTGLLLAAGLTLAGCASPVEAPTLGPVPASIPTPVGAATAEITLERTGCLGSCPVYTVTVFGDGRVVYVGEFNVAVTGRHTATVPVAEVEGLLRRFEAANFFALKDGYWAPITDHPTRLVTLRLNDREKQVADYAGVQVGMPTSVTELETAIDTVACTARWIEGPRAARKCRVK